MSSKKQTIPQNKKPEVFLKKLEFKTLNNGQIIITDKGEDYLPNYLALSLEETHKSLEILNSIKPGKKVVITLSIEVE